MRKFVNYLLLLIIIISLSTAAIAKGGGGGSSGGSSSSSSSSSTSGSSGSSSDNYLFGIECSDRGVLSFYRKPRSDQIDVGVYPTSGNPFNITNLQGTWKQYFFSTDEAVVEKAGIYTVRDNLVGDQNVTCPGLVFSCKIVDININSCSSDTDFKGEFSAVNTPTGNLKFDFETTSGRKLTYSINGSKSKEIQSLKIINSGENLYSIEIPALTEIKKLQISHPECVGKYYIYSKMDCSKQDTGPDENPKSPGSNQVSAPVVTTERTSGKELKCGGYLDIEDRVKCRLDLREDQEDEYQNFYPEYCRVWPREGACLKFYQSVKNCWSTKPGKDRLKCFKGVLKMGKFDQEKDKCEALEEDEEAELACWKDLKYNLRYLIILQLYSLEEDAERLLEQGKLDKNDVIKFVVDIENMKVAFTKAKTYQHRKDVILLARKAWKDLTSKVKP